MADDGSRINRLRDEFHTQTARVPWLDLQTHFARGAVVLVGAGLDLVEVAIQLQLANKQQFQDWIAGSEVMAVSDAQAQRWFTETL